MLRGRGGCYKHAFYGIESHRCMEATPSLACANKCVFCWRHHTNPGALHTQVAGNPCSRAWPHLPGPVCPGGHPICFNTALENQAGKCMS